MKEQPDHVTSVTEALNIWPSKLKDENQAVERDNCDRRFFLRRP